MTDRTLNNSIFLMHLASNAYKQRFALTNEEFLDRDRRFHILHFISECPAVFDSITEPEMAEEISQYVKSFADETYDFLMSQDDGGLSKDWKFDREEANERR